jgi:hypothetical protein
VNTLRVDPPRRSIPYRAVAARLAAVRAPRAIVELHRAPNGLAALGVILRYILAVTEDTAAEEVLQIVASEIPIIEEAMTLAERWKAEGEAKGEIRGRLEGQRALLERLLRLKFAA